MPQCIFGTIVPMVRAQPLSATYQPTPPFGIAALM
jgi:hypothetical protein